MENSWNQVEALYVREGAPAFPRAWPADDRTRSVFERYNIVSECDLVEAAKKLNTLQPIPPATDRNATTKPFSDDVGHNSGAVELDRGPRLTVSL